MRALTVLQPWAHAIAHCGKRVENRSSTQWLGGYRGPLLIHAGKGSAYLSDAACFEINLICPDFPRDLASAMPRLAFGAVVAVATLKDVVHRSDKWKGGLPAGQEPWFIGPWGLILSDVRPLRNPVKASGSQGLWVPSAQLVAQVMDEVEGKRQQAIGNGQQGGEAKASERAGVSGGGLFGSQGRML